MNVPALEISHPDDCECDTCQLRDLNLLFDSRYRAERRGIDRWRAATGKTNYSPDVADFTGWLLDRLDRAEQVIDSARPLGKVQVDTDGLALDTLESSAISMDIALHIAAYDSDYPSDVVPVVDKGGAS